MYMKSPLNAFQNSRLKVMALNFRVLLSLYIPARIISTPLHNSVIHSSLGFPLPSYNYQIRPSTSPSSWKTLVVVYPFTLILELPVRSPLRYRMGRIASAQRQA